MERNAGRLLRADRRLFLEDHAALHDEADLLHHRNVGERIALDRDDVGVLARLDRADRVRADLPI
jgi:hypothetical protein